jgi:hypothetical protein
MPWTAAACRITSLIAPISMLRVTGPARCAVRGVLGSAGRLAHAPHVADMEVVQEAMGSLGAITH